MEVNNKNLKEIIDKYNITFNSLEELSEKLDKIIFENNNIILEKRELVLDILSEK